MPLEPVIALAFILLVAIVVFGLARLERSRQQAREEALRSEARGRGWQFDARDEGVFRVHRWQGTTDGIVWTAEHRRRRQKKRHRHGRTHRVLWWADTLRGPGTPVLFVGVGPGHEVPEVSLAQGDGLLASLARKAAGFAFDQAVDACFGTEAGAQVDAGRLVPVKADVPGYIVMAADASEGQRLLFAGWAEAIGALTRDRTSALADDDRPWILLLPHRVSLARSSPVADAADVERFARAGAALVKRT